MLVLKDAMYNASEEAKNKGAVGESPSILPLADVIF